MKAPRATPDQIKQQRKLDNPSRKSHKKTSSKNIHRVCSPNLSYHYDESNFFHKFNFLIREGNLAGLYTVIVSNEPCIHSTNNFYSDIAMKEALQRLNLLQLSDHDRNLIVLKPESNNSFRSFRSAFHTYSNSKTVLDVYSRRLDIEGTKYFDILPGSNYSKVSSDYDKDDVESKTFPKHHFPELNYCFYYRDLKRNILLNYDLMNLNLRKSSNAWWDCNPFNVIVSRYIPSTDIDSECIEELKSEMFQFKEYLSNSNTAEIKFEFKDSENNQFNFLIQMRDSKSPHDDLEVINHSDFSPAAISIETCFQSWRINLCQ